MNSKDPYEFLLKSCEQLNVFPIVQLNISKNRTRTSEKLNIINKPKSSGKIRACDKFKLLRRITRVDNGKK